MVHGSIKLQFYGSMDSEPSTLDCRPLDVSTGPAVAQSHVLVKERVEVVGQYKTIEIGVEVPCGVVEEDVEEGFDLVRCSDCLAAITEITMRDEYPGPLGK